jgi:hypothetical protein
LIFHVNLLRDAMGKNVVICCDGIGNQAASKRFDLTGRL